MADDDLVYLRRRLADERRLAAEARCAEARDIHRVLADAYDAMVRRAGAPAPGAAWADRTSG